MPDEIMTKIDFESADWQSVIKAAEAKTCDAYAKDFWDRARNADDPKMVAVFQLLGDLTSMTFRLEDKLQPFGPLLRTSNGRSPIPDDFTENHLAVLKEVAAEITDADLLSRIADVLWLRKKDFAAAMRAIDSYLASAAQLQRADDPLGMIKRLERALQLAVHLRRKSIQDILDQFSEAVTVWVAKPQPNAIPIRLMRILQQYRFGDPVAYAKIAGVEAERAETNEDWITAGEFWRIKAKWHLISQDNNGQHEASVHAAETSVKFAEQMAGSPEGYMAGAEHLSSAIEALRKIPGTKQRVAELHPVLLEYQGHGMAAMKQFSHEMDISRFIEQARDAVAGKVFLDALRGLAFMSRPSEVDALRRQAEQLGANSIQAIMPNTRINAEGKRIGRVPALMTDNPAEREIAIRAEMLKNAAQIQELVAVAMVIPAIHQTTMEHDIRVDDLLPIVMDNPLIPQGREAIYAKGLYAGLTGDFLQATHLLIPQLENSVRHLLNQAGAISSGLDSQGIQDERGLPTTLFMPEVKEMLGDAITFDLQGLLVERFGTNFRNNMAHGFYDDGAFTSGRAIYVWWIVLRLCFLFRLLSLQEGPAPMVDNVARTDANGTPGKASD